MQDKIKIKIGDQTIEDFISFEIESNLLNAGDGFKCEINPDYDIKIFDEFKLYINNVLEMQGIVDIVEKTYDKSGLTVTVIGRDLMGLVVDSSVEDFKTFKDISLIDITKELFKNNKYLKQSDIKMVVGSKDDNRTAIVLNKKYEKLQIKPGETIFEFLNGHAQKKGLLFFYQANRVFCYGQFLKFGAPVFSLIHKITDGDRNNVLNAKLIQDGSGLYSVIRCLAQLEFNYETYKKDNYNLNIPVDNTDVPFYKPYVEIAEGFGDEGDLATYCELILKKQKYESNRLSYTVAGLGQKGVIYQTNKIIQVKDEGFEINNKPYLILSRVFKGNKDGYFTDLELTPLGF